MRNIKYGFSANYVKSDGTPVSLSYLTCDDNIVQVCYQMIWVPGFLTSPIYDHEYAKVAPSTKGIPTDLGKVKMFPISKVWPALAVHCVGSLPQLIQ